jgi:hypothetical protein
MRIRIRPLRYDRKCPTEIPMRIRHRTAPLCSSVCFLVFLFCAQGLWGQSPVGKMRVYYVAADEIDWD